MEIGRDVESSSRRSAACYWAAAARDSGVGRSAGELRFAAAGSSTTAKTLSRRCAGNSTLSGWKCHQTRGSASRKRASRCQRPVRRASGALPASDEEELV